MRTHPDDPPVDLCKHVWDWCENVGCELGCDHDRFTCFRCGRMVDSIFNAADYVQLMLQLETREKP